MFFTKATKKHSDTEGRIIIWQTYITCKKEIISVYFKEMYLILFW